MRVFLSWSGERSGQVATALRDWLPNVLQVVDPWLSKRDIDKGARWGIELAKALDTTKVGIICVTRENQENGWLLYEAGAMSKSLDSAFVCPYLVDLKPSDLAGPLAQFQATKAAREDTLALCQTVNRALETGALGEQQLIKVFSKWWPELEEVLSNLSKSSTLSKSSRSDRELLEELVDSVRVLGRGIPSTTSYGWEFVAQFEGSVDRAQEIEQEIRLAAPKAEIAVKRQNQKIIATVDTPTWIPERLLQLVAEKYGFVLRSIDYIA